MSEERAPYVTDSHTEIVERAIADFLEEECESIIYKLDAKLTVRFKWMTPEQRESYVEKIIRQPAPLNPVRNPERAERWLRGVKKRQKEQADLYERRLAEVLRQTNDE